MANVENEEPKLLFTLCIVCSGNREIKGKVCSNCGGAGTTRETEKQAELKVGDAWSKAARERRQKESSSDRLDGI